MNEDSDFASATKETMMRVQWCGGHVMRNNQLANQSICNVAVYFSHAVENNLHKQQSKM